MKIRTSALTNETLDWAVAKAAGEYEHNLAPSEFTKLYGVGEFHYSTNWNIGGPIIEREVILIDGYFSNGEDYKNWATSMHPSNQEAPDFEADGPTILISAMRCFVLSKLGSEVEIPEELT